MPADVHFPLERRIWRSSQMSVAIQTAALTSKNTTTAVNEMNRPMRNAAMVETAKERGKLQKMRSTSERCRKLWKIGEPSGDVTGADSCRNKGGIASVLQ